MKNRVFKLWTFLFATNVIIFLTILSFISAGAIDEGTTDADLITRTFAALFTLFRFPSLTLFDDYINGSRFFIGLFINCIFYGILIERIIAFIKNK